MTDPTSLIFICCIELLLIGKFICNIWRIYFDKTLSVVLAKLETIHEKLNHLNVTRTINIKTVYWHPTIEITLIVILYMIHQGTELMMMVQKSFKIKFIVIINIFTYFIRL